MRTHLLTTAAIVLLSASCGNDSGPALESNTAADVAPPTVTALVPAPGDTNVWVHAPITVRFSAPVRIPADRTVVLALTGGGSIDTTVARSADGRTLTIVPDSFPPSSSLVTVNFRAPVTDPAGRAVVIPAWWWIVPQWQQVAPSLQLGFGYNSVEVAAARDGSVYVAEQFSESPWSFANYVGVHKAEAGTWTSLGGPPGISGTYFGCPIVIGPDELPIVARRSSEQINIDRFDGTAWQQLGDPIPASHSDGPYRVRMVLDASGHPVVAWPQYDGPPDGAEPVIQLARWSGSAWASLGSVRSVGTAFDLAASPDGSLSLATTDGVILSIARSSEGWWRLHSVTQPAQELALALDEDGREVVAIIDPAGEVHVLRWAGSESSPAYRELGTSPSAAARHVAIRSRPNGRPGARLVLSFLDTGPRVLGWDGEEWVSLAQEIATPGSELYTYDNVGSWALAVSPLGDLVYAWAEYQNEYDSPLDTFVVRYND